MTNFRFFLKRLRNAFKRHPVYQVTRVFERRGHTCWVMPSEDFDLYFDFALEMPEGETVAWTSYAGQHIIVFRGEPDE